MGVRLAGEVHQVHRCRDGLGDPAQRDAVHLVEGAAQGVAVVHELLEGTLEAVVVERAGEGVEGGDVLVVQPHVPGGLLAEPQGELAVRQVGSGLRSVRHRRRLR